MRVLFLTLYPQSVASSRYRVLQFLPYLREQGVECTVASAMTAEGYARLSTSESGRAWRYHAVETRRRVMQLLGARRYDVVFLQKAIMSAYLKGMSRMLAMCAPKLVYDIDDAVNLAAPHSLRGVWRRLEDPGQINKAMARADLVLAGNRWLQSVAEAAGGKAELFPTVVDTERFVPGEAAPDAYRIGWIGSPSTTPSLDGIAETLRAVEGAELCLVGADENSAGVEGFEIRPWTYESEVSELQRFSVGIMPLPKTEWSRGKCGLKALQYMACGVPVVATPFGAVCDIVEDGKNGLLADSPEEWTEALARLRDAKLRRELGQAGRATVEERYSLRVAAPRLLALLESVA